jgi:hypothetical protein
MWFAWHPIKYRQGVCPPAHYVGGIERLDTDNWGGTRSRRTWEKEGRKEDGWSGHAGMRFRTRRDVKGYAGPSILCCRPVRMFPLCVGHGDEREHEVEVKPNRWLSHTWPTTSVADVSLPSPLLLLSFSWPCHTSSPTAADGLDS